jgi:trehalose utilization protein
MTAEKLAETDVLIWWGHAAHGDVDRSLERVVEAVWSGMGIIFLHSAHFSKPFKRLMGAPCNLTWREAGERERLWVTSRQHPIAARHPRPFRAGKRRDVWRTLRRARTAGNRVRVVVRRAARCSARA